MVLFLLCKDHSVVDACTKNLYSSLNSFHELYYEKNYIESQKRMLVQILEEPEFSGKRNNQTGTHECMNLESLPSTNALKAVWTYSRTSMARTPLEP